MKPFSSKPDMVAHIAKNLIRNYGEMEHVLKHGNAMQIAFGKAIQ